MFRVIEIKNLLVEWREFLTKQKFTRRRFEGDKNLIGKMHFEIIIKMIQDGGEIRMKFIVPSFKDGLMHKNFGNTILIT